MYNYDGKRRNSLLHILREGAHLMEVEGLEGPQITQDMLLAPTGLVRKRDHKQVADFAHMSLMADLTVQHACPPKEASN